MAVCALGQHTRAAQLCAAADRVREQEHAPRPPAEQQLYDQIFTAVQVVLGDERFEQAWAAGRTLSLDDAISYALAEPSEW